MEQKNKSLESSNQETSTNLVTDDEELYYYEDDEDELPPAMPEQLPSLIRLLVSRTPKIYKPTVAQAVFPSLAAHLYKVKFRYIDNVDHEATLMNVLMAPTGTGKSCINAPINHIMADIRERDRVNMDREREWREQMSTMGTHKYKPARPKNLVIQDIDPNMTMAAFALRSVEAKGHFLYSQMNEIDQWDTIEGTGRGRNKGLKFRIMCLAFDPDNSFGQTRVSPEAVNEHFQIRYNWNACTTIGKGQQYFRKVVNDGPVSRINFCTIPQRVIGASIPQFGTYDETFDEQLRPYIQHLCKVRDQRVECPEHSRDDQDVDEAWLSPVRPSERQDSLPQGILCEIGAVSVMRGDVQQMNVTTCVEYLASSKNF